MKSIEITSKNQFNNAIRQGVSLIDFNAPWCGPCRLQEPILEKITAQFNGKVTIAAVNVDRLQDIAVLFGIQSIPTIILFKDRKEIKRFIGLQTEKTLTDTLIKLTD